ncbi:hypothetical protein V3N99_22025 [Dermatophilaceae bacterium Soc4.6]
MDAVGRPQRLSGERVLPRAEQVPHLLCRERVTYGEAADPHQAGADPPAQGLALS